MTRALVLVVSAEVQAQTREDKAGPRAVALLSAQAIEAHAAVVPPEALEVALEEAVARYDVVVTCGGTSVRPGDRVPELTRALGLVELPGIAEEIRRRGAAASSGALTSRGVCGVVDRGAHRCLVLNAPSSSAGVEDAVGVLVEVVGHLLRDMAGRRRSPRRPEL